MKLNEGKKPEQNLNSDKPENRVSEKGLNSKTECTKNE